MYLAARLGLMQLVQQLVKQGANVNIAEQDGWTPLMSAAVKVCVCARVCVSLFHMCVQSTG